MYWNDIPAQQDSRRTLLLFTGLFVGGQAFGMLWIVITGVGFEVSSVGGLVRITPLYAIQTAVLLVIMKRTGMLLRGRSCRPARCHPLPVVAAGVLVLVAQVPAIALHQADYVYFQFDDYATFLVLGGLRMVFLEPLMQEILCRGLLFAALKHRGLLAAYGISTAVYVAAHVPLTALIAEGRLLLPMHAAVSLTVTGLTCAWLVNYTGLIIAPIIVHMVGAAAVWYAPAVRYGILLLRGGSL